MYWEVALNGNTMYTLKDANAVINDYGFESSWRAIDNETKDIWNAADPEDAEAYLWAYLPNVFILHTGSMTLTKTQDLDGNIDVPAEVEAINNE